MQAMQAANGELARSEDESGGASVQRDRFARARRKRQPSDALRLKRAAEHELASTGARISQRDGNYAAPVCRRTTDAAAEISIEKRR